MTSRLLACALAVMLVHVYNEARLFAQACPPIPSGGGESLEGFVVKSDNSCQAAPATYVVRGNQYTLHTKATADGSCTLRAYDTQTQQCVITAVQQRGVSGTYVSVVLPINPGAYAIGPIYPVNAQGMSEIRHEMDSRIPNTTVPPGRTWSAFYEGETTFQFRENIYPTSCN